MSSTSPIRTVQTAEKPSCPVASTTRGTDRTLATPSNAMNKARNALNARPVHTRPLDTGFICSLLSKELDQRRSQHLRLHHVRLPLQRPTPGVRQDRGQRLHSVL